MIVALCDYLSYRMRIGRYSGRAIEALGGKLADADHWSGDNRPGPGQYIVVHTRNSFLSWLVMYFTDSVWSHSAIVVDRGDIVEVTLAGTVAHPFKDCLNDQDYIIASRDSLTMDQQRGIIGDARSRVGVTKFGYRIALHIGLRTLAGRDSAYRFRLSLDVITPVLTACYFGRHRRRLAIIGFLSSFFYLIVVASNCKRRKEERLLKSQAIDKARADMHSG
jgi:hypothetical protein